MYHHFAESMDGSDIPDAASIMWIAELLGLDPSSLKQCLTTRSITTHSDTVVSDRLGAIPLEILKPLVCYMIS